MFYVEEVGAQHRSRTPAIFAPRGTTESALSCYAEFALLSDNAEEYGLTWSRPPRVERRSVEVAPGRAVSALVWGAGAPEIVLLHGGAQNAHTWDTVALALGRPLVAVDLPGHGHSVWREDLDYAPRSLAADVEPALRALAPEAGLLVGMSLGGLTAIALASRSPDLAARLALVDVTPGVTLKKGRAIADFVAGPETFASFDEILERTVAFNPGRSVRSLRRGAMHNAVQREDGRWVWRYDRRPRRGPDGWNLTGLWDELARIRAPLMLVRGELSGVVDDADLAELLRRRPDARVEVVAGAGHSVQGDRPLELARLLKEFRGTPG